MICSSHFNVLQVVKCVYSYFNNITESPGILLINKLISKININGFVHAP